MYTWMREGARGIDTCANRLHKGITTTVAICCTTYVISVPDTFASRVRQTFPIYRVSWWN